MIRIVPSSCFLFPFIASGETQWPPRRFLPFDRDPRRDGSGPFAIEVQGVELAHDADGEANAWVVGVEHVIAAVDIVDVDVIGVIPA
jgi:hypothetical protein